MTAEHLSTALMPYSECHVTCHWDLIVNPKKDQMMKCLIVFVFCLSCYTLYPQTGFIGGRDDPSIVVTTSSNQQRSGWETTASGYHTIDGSGLHAKYLDASRFLAQSTLGSSMDDIERLVQDDLDFETWIEEQASIPQTSYLQVLKDVYGEVYDFYIGEGGDPNEFRCRPKWYHANYAWWQMVITAEDLLRQRIALALSEILVISKERSDLENYGYAVASYYDIFIKHALGNYLDILKEVTFHPAMGNFLSHFNNPKSDVSINRYPDENFAREFMQLFTIGVYELHDDGTLQFGENGMPLQTYNNDDIDDLAKIFTGLGAGATTNCGEGFGPAFGLSIRKSDMTHPMKMYPEWHEPGEKTIIGGYTIPAGQTGEEDIHQAIEHIFIHPNVGPFISRKLIQQLVKSNPSPGYVQRVGQAFNDNGQGVRGDMKAVIKAILLDEEARSCDAMTNPDHGKLRSPILRYAHFARAMDKFAPLDRYWDSGSDYLYATGQFPLHAASVFNFYQPDFQPNGRLRDAGLYAPEFQLLNSVTGLQYFNEVNKWTVYEELFRHRETDTDSRVYIDIYRVMGNARDPETMINYLDILLTHGQLTDHSRDLLRTVLEGYSEEGISLLIDRTLLALYFFMVSPDYTIFK